MALIASALTVALLLVSTEAVAFELVADGQECGDTQQVRLSSNTSNASTCAVLARADDRCSRYFEVRKEKEQCRCNAVGMPCQFNTDRNTILYQLLNATTTLAPTTMSQTLATTVSSKSQTTTFAITLSTTVAIPAITIAATTIITTSLATATTSTSFNLAGASQYGRFAQGTCRSNGMDTIADPETCAGAAAALQLRPSEELKIKISNETPRPEACHFHVDTSILYFSTNPANSGNGAMTPDPANPGGKPWEIVCMQVAFAAAAPQEGDNMIILASAIGGTTLVLCFCAIFAYRSRATTKKFQV